MRKRDKGTRTYGEIVVDTVEEKVEHEKEGGVREESVDMEQEAVERVLEDGPEDVPGEEAREGGSGGDSSAGSVRELAKEGFVDHAEGDGEPDEGDDPPRGEGEHLEVGLGEELGGVGEMARLVHLLEIE